MSREVVTYTQKNLMKLMADHKKLCVEAYVTGSIPHVEMLIDIDLMLKEAKLTDRQLEVVQYHYFEQMTQEETAEMMGITQQTVLDHIGAIKKKVKTVALKWGEANERI